MTPLLHAFLAGAGATGYVVASAFFARFYRDTKERLFGLFAFAFLLFAVNRGLLVLVTARESHAQLYLLRLAAFLLIALAVIDRNRRGRV